MLLHINLLPGFLLAIIQLFLHITTLLRAENCDVEAVSFAEMETCRTMLKLVTAIVRASKNDPSRSKCCDDFRALNGKTTRR